jgi:hypothetical protein
MGKGQQTGERHTRLERDCIHVRTPAGQFEWVFLASCTVFDEVMTRISSQGCFLLSIARPAWRLAISL